MSIPLPRRHFLRTMGGTAAFLGDWGWPFAGPLQAVRAEEARLLPGQVKFSPELEPLVRLLEDTPRERLMEEVGSRIKAGTYQYRQVLAAVLLAGIRNIQPRPVGFKFHAVLVVHSAHLASMNSPDQDRWLPLFWALDQFKSSQARDIAEGDWTMSAVDEKAVPPAGESAAAFAAAMDAWDVPRVDSAVAGLTRSAGAQDVFDRFCRYGARDFRDIGHKAIYVANSWRTLQTIGWHHAEPVLRSLAYALLEHEQGNPRDRDAEADAPGRHNEGLLRQIRPGWTSGILAPHATPELLAVLRQGNWQDASHKAVELLNASVDPQCLWDAYFQHAAEMLMRKPGIVSLHAVTTTNALRFAWQQCHDDTTRRFLLLQNASFLTLFRNAAGAGEGTLITDLTPSPGTTSLPALFETISADKMAAASHALGYLQQGGSAQEFIAAAQRLIYLKGTDSHDYKFSSAVFEDYHHLSPEIRDRFLAASTFWLQGSARGDNPLVGRIRDAMRA